MSYKFVVSETEQGTHKFAPVMLQEVELSAEPDRLLVNYTIIPDPILVYVCACFCVQVVLNTEVNYVYENDL